ncbi:AAA family ATPase [Nocardia gipuzkoensis]
MLCGRRAELTVLAELLEGRCGALIVRGEAGIGKSALLEASAARAQARVLRVTGVESEADLPFAALHLLLGPVLDQVETLPRQQAEALRGALGLADATRGDRFLVGLATLGLLVELSAIGPVVCLVDDAQWLDGESADALLFAARRLHGEPVVVLFAAREDRFNARGLPELRLGRLDDSAARMLLAEHAADLPPAVRDRLLAEAAGNPLALIEMPRMLTPGQRRGALAPMPMLFATTAPVTDRVLSGFRDRIAVLAPATRSCLLVAALANHDELRVLDYAVGRLGATLADFAEAERAGLIRVWPESVEFHHPLVRAAVVTACDVSARMAAHRALAEASGADRRAWHLAALTLQPDEEVAGQLESLALRAQQRGGQAAVSAALSRAAELSADPGRAVHRWTAAADAAIEAGLWQRAGELVNSARERAGATPLEGSVLAELAHVRAKLAVAAGRPLQGVRLLVEEVDAVDDLPTRLSLLGMASYYTWASATHPDQPMLARRIEELCPEGEGLPAVVRSIVRAFRLILEGDEVTTLAYPIPGSAVHLPPELRFLINFQSLARADIGDMLDGATGLVEDCRAEGRLGRMPQAMLLLAIAQLLAGRHRSARATVTAGLALASDVGQPMWRGYLSGVHAWLSAVSGAEAECEAMAGQAILDADSDWWMPAACWAESARAMLDFGLGRYDAVLDRMERALTGPTRLGAVPWSDRAACELRATGVAVRPPGPGDPLAALTPQELQVVRLAGEGASNREIGAQLFLSPRTVSSHLYKAFPKLGISSRAELSKLLD